MCLYITLFFISQDSLVLVQKNVSLLSQSLLWFMNKKKKITCHILFMLEDLQKQAQILVLGIRLAVMVSEQVLMLVEGKQNPK